MWVQFQLGLHLLKVNCVICCFLKIKKKVSILKNIFFCFFDPWDCAGNSWKTSAEQVQCFSFFCFFFKWCLLKWWICILRSQSNIFTSKTPIYHINSQGFIRKHPKKARYVLYIPYMLWNVLMFCVWRTSSDWYFYMSHLCSCWLFFLFFLLLLLLLLWQSGTVFKGVSPGT